MKSPATMFLIFSIGFAIIALFAPANDVQQGQAIGLSLFTDGIAWAMNEGDKQACRIANKRTQQRKKI